MKKKKTGEQIVLWLIIAASFLATIPLLYLCMYNHPSADDYMYAANTYHVWRDTHSLWEVWQAALATSAEFYQTWQGLYASAVLQALEPGIFGESYYKFAGMIILATLYGTNLIFSNCILHKKLGMTGLESAAFGCILSFLMLQWIPSAVQGIYWYNGAVNYTFFYCVMILLICAVLQLGDGESKRKSAGWLILSILLGVVLTGGNHVTAFMGILFLLGSAIFGFIAHKKKFMMRSFVVFLFMIAGFLVNVSSPGTKVRQEAFENTPGVFMTIWYAMKRGAGVINVWLGLAIVVCLIIMLPFVLRAVIRVRNETGFAFPYPLLVVVLSVGWLCAMYCPPIYAMGGSGDGRLVNVVYFSFVVLMFLNEFYICGWLVEHFIKVNDGHTNEIRLSQQYSLVAVVLVVGMILGCGESSAGYQAFLQLKTGAAARYSSEADARFQILETSRGKDVVLDAYTEQPYMIFFDDITEDSSDWRNQYMLEYFELNSVALKKNNKE